MTSPPTLLTAKEVAGRLNVSTRTVLRWAQGGQIPCVRLPGGTVRFAPSAVDALVEGDAA